LENDKSPLKNLKGKRGFFSANETQRSNNHTQNCTPKVGNNIWGVFYWLEIDLLIPPTQQMVSKKNKSVDRNTLFFYFI